MGLIQRLLCATATLAIILGFAVPMSAAAATGVFNDACSTPAAKASAVCAGTTTVNPISGTNGILMKAATIVSIIAGAAAVIFIIISGMRYILSAGDAAKAAQARNSILYALAGLVVIILARSIIGLVISRI
jgi:hypothetical protein